MSIYAAYSVLGLCIFKSKRTNIFMRSFALNISNCCHLFHHHCLLLIKVPLFVLDTRMQTAERDSLLRAPVVIYTTHIIVAKQNLSYNIPLFQLKKR